MSTCKEIMTKDPAICLTTDTIQRASELMKSEDVGSIPVVDDQGTRRLVGIVTDRDVVLEVVAEGKDPKTTTVSDVMSSSLVTCHEDDTLDQAIQAMARAQVRRLPIVDVSGALLGIIAQADVAQSGKDKRTGQLVEEISS